MELDPGFPGHQWPGATGKADMIRIMEPTPKYPNGYARASATRMANLWMSSGSQGRLRLRTSLRTTWVRGQGGRVGERA